MITFTILYLHCPIATPDSNSCPMLGITIPVHINFKEMDTRNFFTFPEPGRGNKNLDRMRLSGSVNGQATWKLLLWTDMIAMPCQLSQDKCPADGDSKRNGVLVRNQKAEPNQVTGLCWKLSSTDFSRGKLVPWGLRITVKVDAPCDFLHLDQKGLVPLVSTLSVPEP